MLPVLLTVFICLFLVVSYIVYNLYSKNVKLEQAIINQNNYILEMDKLHKEFIDLSKQIDSKIWVQSDPELMGIFDVIKRVEAESEKFVIQYK